MSYYDQSLLPSQGGTVQPSTGGGYVTRQVAPNELVSHQLTDLLGADSPYIQQARQQAAAAAASRGLSNSSMAAGAGQAAAIAAGLPIATSDAGMYGKTAADNMDAANTYRIRQGDWANAITTAGIGAGASKYNADLDFKLGQAQLDEKKNEYGTDWTHQVQGALLGNALGNRTGLNSALYSTIFSDPNLYGNPAGASGMINYWQGQFGSDLNSQISPEFLASLGITLPPGPGGGA